MTRQLTVVQPLPPGDHAPSMRADPETWLPDPRHIGPRAWRITLHVGGVERSVRCEVGDPWTTPEAVQRRIVWTPLPEDHDVLPFERWLPALTGELYLVGAPATPSLALVGEVEVPMGRVGEAVDALLLGRVAQRGAATFLSEVGARMAPQAPHPSHPPQPEPAQSVASGAHHSS